jgi:hypothetical protein
VANGESTAGWFRTITSFSDTQIANDFASRYAAGYPLDNLTNCADAPTADHRCAGYQYYGPLMSPFTYPTPAYIATQTDWDTGQSGGPVYGSLPGVSQFATIGIISYSGTSSSSLRRVTSAITSKLCEQVQAFPSSAFPSHECGS